MILMISLLTILFFILGLAIGSFLNVVIYRWGTRRGFGGRSTCVSCQSALCWYELIPLASFCALRGRCRVCKTRISRVYPAVELMTGLIFLGLFLKFQDLFFLNALSFIFTYAYYAAMFSILVVIAFYDLKHKVIPDSFSLILGAVSFFGLFFFGGHSFNVRMPSISEFLSGPVLASPFALFWLVSKGRWMGLGDAKLALGLGWLIGLSRMLSGVVIAFWSGAVFGILLILRRRGYGIKSEVPFAPFLVLGALLAFLFELHIFPVF